MTGAIKLVIESHGTGAPIEHHGKPYQVTEAHEHNERWAPRAPVDTFKGQVGRGSDESFYEWHV